MNIRIFKFLTLAFCVVLTSCGGGGGGSSGESTNGAGTSAPIPLFVNVSYSTNAISLYTPSLVTPILSGFGQHAPICSLVSGSALQPGLTLNSDCTISGTPTVVGTYNFTLHVGAVGASNTIDISASLTVQGPTPFYFDHTYGSSAFNVGYAVNESSNLGWTIPAGLSTTWLYQIQSGSLPPGLTLNSSTGVISGTTSTQGLYQAYISVTLTTIYGTVSLGTASYFANVAIPTFGYVNSGATGGYSNLFNAFVSQPFSATPTVNSGVLSNFTLAGTALPAGLSLDPNTGIVSGTPTSPSLSYNSSISIPVNATLTIGGINYAATGSVPMDIKVPVTVSYPYGVSAVAGAPKTITPIINQVSPISIAGATYQFTARTPDGLNGCPLPSGMTLNATTGVVSGNPVAGANHCTVDVTITNNSVIWVQPAQIDLVVN